MRSGLLSRSKVCLLDISLLMTVKGKYHERLVS